MYDGTQHEARHRLLEAFLLRVAMHPDADAFVLRGGMLVRQWFAQLDRPALDVDLVCQHPCDAAAMRDRLTEILSLPVDDDVVFYAEGFRLDATWVGTSYPGFKLFAAGWVQGWPADMTADITFRLPVWPTPERAQICTPGGRATLQACRPETLIGRKLQVVAELGRMYWRPKDLNDVRLLLSRFDIPIGHLGRALDASFEGYAETLADVREAFGNTSWWDSPQAEARWHRYVHDCRGYDVPSDFRAVVGDVRQRIRPLLT